MNSDFFIGAPGVGKTTLQRKSPGRFIDPEESIDWKRMDKLHSLYFQKKRRVEDAVILEHELDWPTVWLEEVLPRIWTALALEKDILMGLITPSNAEMVHRFLAAFQKNTQLILPAEEQHFLQTWNHGTRRPKTWGPQLMGWQNTFWIRLLLVGLATDLKIPIVTQPKHLPKKKPRIKGSFACEALDESGRLFIETLYDRWAELNEKEEIIALYKAKIEDGGLLLTCDRSGKLCGKGMHDCKKSLQLKQDIHGHSLLEWLPQNKLRAPVKRSKKNALLFFAGTLAPVHHGHLDALDAAKKFLESRGWHVLGGYMSAFENLKEGRVGSLDAILKSASRRTSMLRLGTLCSDWLMPDVLVEHVLRANMLKEQRHPVQRVASRLRQQGALSQDTPVTTFWVNGKDAHFDPEFFSAFAAHADDDSNNPLRMLIVDNRPGEDMWSKKQLASSTPELIPHTDWCRFHQTEPTSATVVREALLSANRLELKKHVGLPLVEAYLTGLMHENTISYS
jgi:hypothetical protein